MTEFLRRQVAFLAVGLALVPLLLVPVTSARGDFAEGQALYERQRWAQALAELRPIAESGDPLAQYLVGTMLDEGGHGIARDRISAALWYRRAAEGGSDAALFALYMAEPAPGGDPAAEAAHQLHWAERLARRGGRLEGLDRDRAALCAEHLGLAYGRGFVPGAPRDLGVGVAWLIVAERLGRADASGLREEWEAELGADAAADAARLAEAVLAAAPAR